MICGAKDARGPRAAGRCSPAPHSWDLRMFCIPGWGQDLRSPPLYFCAPAPSAAHLRSAAGANGTNPQDNEPGGGRRWALSEEGELLLLERPKRAINPPIQRRARALSSRRKAWDVSAGGLTAPRPLLKWPLQQSCSAARDITPRSFPYAAHALQPPPTTHTHSPLAPGPAPHSTALRTHRPFPAYNPLGCPSEPGGEGARIWGGPQASPSRWAALLHEDRQRSAGPVLQHAPLRLSVCPKPAWQQQEESTEPSAGVHATIAQP